VAEILETRGQFIIPFFQRHCSWEQKQWRWLWNDLLRVLDDEPRPDSGASVHVLGPLVTIPHTNTPGSLPRWQVIDGQQRPTTLTPPLAALRDVFLERAAESQAADIMDTCLIKTHKAGLERLKVAATARLSLVTITLEGENPYEILKA
jgi:uncharacterized protein with ParB-like and HNH nuclease domain